MIIWGSRVKVLEEGSGLFDCPRCSSRQRYVRLRVAKYFTLYFVPLFETQSMGELARCQACHSEFHNIGLNGEPKAETWTCPTCARPNSAHVFQCRSCRFCLL